MSESRDPIELLESLKESQRRASQFNAETLAVNLQHEFELRDLRRKLKRAHEREDGYMFAFQALCEALCAHGYCPDDLLELESPVGCYKKSGNSHKCWLSALIEGDYIDDYELEDLI